MYLLKMHLFLADELHSIATSSCFTSYSICLDLASFKSIRYHASHIWVVSWNSSRLFLLWKVSCRHVTVHITYQTFLGWNCEMDMAVNFTIIFWNTGSFLTAGLRLVYASISWCLFNASGSSCWIEWFVE